MFHFLNNQIKPNIFVFFFFIISSIKIFTNIDFFFNFCLNHDHRSYDICLFMHRNKALNVSKTKQNCSAINRTKLQYTCFFFLIKQNLSQSVFNIQKFSKVWNWYKTMCVGFLNSFFSVFKFLLFYILWWNLQKNNSYFLFTLLVFS